MSMRVTTVEAVTELRHQGLEVGEVAHRLGISLRSTYRALARARREHPDSPTDPTPAQEACVTGLAGLRETVAAQAACRHTDPDTFFPDRADGDFAYARAVAHAKAICGPCPVRARCLQLALTTPEAHGVWGGTSEEERAAGWSPPAPSANPPAGGA